MRARCFLGLGAVVLIGAAAPAPAGAQSGISAERVAAYPSPGTFAASAQTQISFRGRPANELGPIVVSGSRTGRHPGRLRPHSDGRGASYVMNGRFRAGETVTVRTSLPIAATSRGDFRFRIAQGPGRVVIPKRILEGFDAGKTTRYRSRPDLRPPVVTVSPNARPVEPGLVVLSPKAKKDTAQAGPMLIDLRGEPVWFRPLGGVTAATDFRVQEYQGKPVLTYWQGTSRQGIGYGDLVILDDSYSVVKRLRPPNGFRADLHEFLITPRDTALVIAYPAVGADLSRFGGSRRGRVIDSVIQEIDIATGLVIFEWHSLGKVPLADGFTAPIPSPAVPWDYFHANSVSLDSDGDILVSARNTWGIYKLDRATGRIEWTLGGKRSSFKLGAGVKFAWQHDARRRADGALTLFDNSAFPPIRKRSRVLALKLDMGTRTARLLTNRVHPRGLLAATQGNHQTLPSGGAFVGWGSQRYFTEYDSRGRIVWDARVAVGYETYRAYRSPWTGRPATRPRAAGVRRSPDSVEVYASWNGSTETARWEILEGASPDSLQPVTSVDRSGFETHTLVGSRNRYVAARALDANGAVLSTSPAARVKGCAGRRVSRC